MKKSFLPTLFALALCLVLLPASAFAADEIEYYGADSATSDYTELTSDNAGSVTSGIYYVSGEVSVGALTFNGDTTLVLGSNATLTVSNTLICGGNLTVTTVKDATGAKLVAKGSDATSDSSHGIYAQNGSVNIYAGTVEATGGARGNSSYGIKATDSVNIYAGEVNATGGTTSGSYATSYGICAQNGGVTVSGGTVEATGGEAGGGSYGIYAHGGSVTVTGGTVTAKGGTASGESAGSHGIYAQKDMTVSGAAEVTATSGTGERSYGIYVAENGMTVSDSATVEATSGTATGDYWGSYGINVTGGMTVSGSATVTATGGEVTGDDADSYGIYTYGNVTISGGTVKLTAGSTIEGTLKTEVTGKTLADYLADGTAYAQESDSDWTVVDGSGTSLSNVKVVAHTHAYDSSTGKCACGKQCSHSFANSWSVCTVCNMSCSHDFDFTCSKCGAYFPVRGYWYYATSIKALFNKTELSDIELAPNMAEHGYKDANGNGLLTESGTVEIKISSDYTDNFDLILNGNTLKTNLSITGSTTVNIQSGSTEDTVYSGTVDGNVTVKNGALNVGDENGSVTITGNLTYGEADNTNNISGTLYSGVTVKGTLKTEVTDASLADYLADGTAYEKDGTVVDGKVAELSNVKVVAHTHDFSTNATKCACGFTCDHSSCDDTGKCIAEGCGYQMSVKAVAYDSSDAVVATFWNTDIYKLLHVNTLFSTEGADHFTITLYDDVTAKSGNMVTLQGVTVTLDLNGHSYDNANSAGISVGHHSSTVGGFLTVIDSGAAKTGKITGTVGVESSGSTLTLKSGSFGRLAWIDGFTPADLLAAGCAFQKTDDNSMVKLSSLSGTELTDVKVVECTSHSYSSGACQYCGTECAHTDVNAETGYCTADGCGYQCPVKVTDASENNSWYKDFDTAKNNADGKTITLMADVAGSSWSIESETFTLDLNGHKFDRTITVGVLYATQGTLTIKDSGTGGTVANLTVNSGSVTVTGGSFTLIHSNTGETLKGILGTGYAFQETGDSSLLVRNDLTNMLQNVKVVECTDHSFGTDDACKYCGFTCAHTSVNSSTGKCSVCEKQFAASVSGTTTGGNPTEEVYYATFNAAYEAAQSGDTVTLLANEVKFVSASGQNPEISKSITIDLNGKTLIGQFTYTTVTNGRVGVSGDNVEVTIKGNGTVGGDGLQITKGGALTLDGVTVSKNVLAYNGGKLTVNSATITGKLSVGEYTSSGSDTLTMSGGSAGTLAVYSGSTVTLTGGTFDNVTCGDNVSIGSLPAEGYAFKTTGGTWYDAYNNSDTTSISSQVTVTAAPVKSVSISTTNNETSFTYGKSFTLTADTVDGAGYQWYTVSGDTETLIDEETDTAYSPTGFKADTYTFRVKVTKDGYTKSADVTVTVDKATLDEEEGDYISPDPRNTTYNGEDQALLSNYSSTDIGTFYYSLDSGEPKTWSTDIPTAKDVGDYTVYWYVKGDENHNDTVPASVTAKIKQKRLEVPSGTLESPLVFCTPSSTLTYNGQPQTPTFQLELKTKPESKPDGTTVESVLIETLVEGTDYTVSVTPQTNVGEEYAITFTGKGNYTGTATKTWSIGKAAAPSLPATTTVEIVYTLTPYTVDLSTAITGMPDDAGTVSYSLPDGVDSIYSINDNILTIDDDTYGAGGYYMVSVYVSSTNYKNSMSQVNVYLIDKTAKPLTVNMTGWTYGDTANRPSYTKATGAGDVTVEYKLANAADSAYSTTVPTDAGDYTVKVSYETTTEKWSGTADFTVAKKSIADAGIEVDQSIFTYNGQLQKPTVTIVSLGGLKLDADNYTVSCDAQTNASEDYTLTVTGTGNYTGTAKKTWKITKANITITDFTPDTKAYDGTDAATVASVTFDGLVEGQTLTKDTDYTVRQAWFDSRNAGSNRTVQANFALTDSAAANNYELISGTVTVYNGTIEKRPITVSSVTVKDKSYDGKTDAKVEAVSFSGLVDGEELNESADYTVTASFADAAAGDSEKTVTYTVTLKDDYSAKNYTLLNGTGTATAKINKGKTVVLSHPTGKSLPYSGLSQELLGSAGTASTGGTMVYKVGEDGTWSEAIPTATDAKDYTIYYKSKGDGVNYTDSDEESIRALIYAVRLTVTAKPHSITYGDAPAGNSGVSYDGFVGNDSATNNDLTGTLRYDYGYNRYDNVGSHYWIRPSGLSSNNYNITYASGTLTVEPKEIGIDWTNTSFVYDGQKKLPTATATDLVRDDDSCILTVIGEQTDAGDNYTATVTGLSNSNYKLPTDATTAFTIAKAGQTVTATAASVSGTYGDTDKSVSASGIGTVSYAVTSGRDVVSVAANGKLTFLKAGEATVTATASGDSNHERGTVDITVTVAKATLTVTAKPHSITYGDAPASNGVEYSGFVNGEDASVLTGTLGYDYSYTQYGDVGSNYTITPKGLSSTNYSISFVPGTLTVEQKVVGLSWTNTSLVYDGQQKLPTATATGTVNSDRVDVTVSGAQVNAGDNYTATAIGLSGDKAANYKLPDVVTATFTIAKGELPTASYPTSLNGSKGNKLSTVTLPDGWTWVDGTQVMSAIGEQTFAANYAGTSNYNAKSGVQLTVNVSNKESKALTVSMSGWTYGGTASAPSYTTATGASAATVKYVGRNSTVYAESTAVPTGAGDYTVSVSYETATEIWSGTADFTVAKATPTGAPKYTALSGGKTLADANLTTEGGTFSVAGTVQWVDANGNALAGTTEVAANTAYQWVFTPSDSDNYNAIGGSVTLWHKSSSSSGSTTKPVTVPVASDHATVEVKAEVSKGNATINVSDEQIEKVAADHAGEVTLDVSGLKNVNSATIPAHVVEKTNEAENTGLTVALPSGSVTLDETALESVTEAASGKDVDISVVSVPTEKLPTAVKEVIGMEPTVVAVVDVNVTVGSTKHSGFNGGKVKISIPYTPKAGEDTSKLTVWFIKDDGTIENKGGYYDAAKKCFVFETEHLSQYLLVNTNGLVSFTDVAASSWYAASVNWAVSNGITNGTSATTFSPAMTCTRAQIVTFLWRAAIAQGVDVSVGEDTNILSYTDALEVPEYAVAAFQWAVGAGIVQGADGKLMPSDDCTRAQIVTMLYRYAVATGKDVSVGEDTNILSYADALEVPGYAVEPFQWAVGAGIVQGTDGKLLPKDSCTRAQIVTMLYRSMK